MRNILQYGHFTIESRQGCNDIHDAVRVDLDDKKLAKKNFTLDELRDLESKLVLITGSKTEQRKQVDLFLDVSLWRLLALCFVSSLNVYCIVKETSVIFLKLQNALVQCNTCSDYSIELCSYSMHVYMFCL